MKGKNKNTANSVSRCCPDDLELGNMIKWFSKQQDLIYMLLPSIPSLPNQMLRNNPFIGL